MGKVISVINQKGGSGKTTTATNFAVCLKKAGFKVLLIDLDGQCNSSFNLGCLNYKEREVSIISILSAILNKQNYSNDYIFKSESDVDLIPSNPNEFTLLSDIATTKVGGLFLLKKFIKKENLQDKYDYIVIDNNGYLGAMVQNSILASTNILIPAGLNTFDLQGMFELINFIQDMLNDEDLNLEKIVVDGVLITNDEPTTKISKEIKNQVQTTFKNIHFFNVTIPHSQDIRKSQFCGKVLCDMEVVSKAKDAYMEFAKEYLYEHE